MAKYVKSIKFSTSGETYTIRDAEQKARLDTLEPKVTSVETALGGKQDTLVSGTNIKTINGNNILGSGNLVIEGGSGGTSDYEQLENKPQIDGKELNKNSTAESLGLATTSSLEGKQDVIDSTHKLDVNLVDGAATTTALETKADASALTAHTENSDIHVTASKKTEWDAKQDKLTSANAGDNITITEVGGVVKINSTGGSGGSTSFANLTGNPEDNDALKDALDAKANEATTLAGYGIADAYTKAEADSEFLSSNQGSENTGKVLGIDSTGEVVPINASGVVTPEGEASVLDNSQPKNLFGVTAEQIVVPTENMLNDESEHCSYASNQGAIGPFLSDFNQAAIRNKQLASVSCCIKTLSTSDNTYPFFVIDLGTDTFPSTKEALSSIVPVSNWRTTYKKLFELTLDSLDIAHLENFKLDGSDPRVTYRNPDYLDSEGYLVIPTGSWVMFGDDRQTDYGKFGYDNSSVAQTEYKKAFAYLSFGGTYGFSSGNFGVSFFERTWETETITKQNFDAYLVTEESGEQVIHSDIIATALSDIEDLKERNPSSPLEGKWLSIIGDSISTFEGWSNIAPGSTSAAVYYPNSGVASPILDVNQTYWKKLIDRTGMNLLVNNSWSGSHCAGSGGSSVVSQTNDRCHQLHKTIDGTVVNPDYILINIGTNDFDHDYEMGTWNGRGVLFPANPTTTSPNTFREAYAVMLYRLRQYYPLAKVFCCTIPCGNNEGGEGLNEINGTGYTLSEWNDAIREVATAFGVKVIEMATAGMDYYTLATLYGDGRVHPSEAGMERMYEIIRPAMENETTSNTSAPRLSKLMTGTATAISDSTASDVSGLVTDFNALLAALRARGVISASE